MFHQAILQIVVSTMFLCGSPFAQGQDVKTSVRPERIGQNPGAGHVPVNIPKQIHPRLLSR